MRREGEETEKKQRVEVILSNLPNGQSVKRRGGNQMPHSILFVPCSTRLYRVLKRTSRCGEKMHLLPLAWQQPVCVSLAGLVVQMFEMARVMNYGSELPAAQTSLATVFFSHSHQCLLWPDQRPLSPGLKGKHLQSCWTVLSCSINVTLSALVVRYFWAGEGRTQTIKVRRKIPWVC